jgi:small subunit ribosomal protein S20
VLDWPAVANITSQIKRNRQNRRHEERNKAVRSRLKTEAKKVRATAETGDAEAASAQLRSTARLLDKAASKGVVHKRTAARRKSKLARAAARSAPQG